MPRPAVFTRKRHEYDDVYSFWFRHPGLRYEAGRYAHVLVGQLWRGDAVRELSFASAPYEDGVDTVRNTPLACSVVGVAAAGEVSAAR